MYPFDMCFEAGNTRILLAAISLGSRRFGLNHILNRPRSGLFEVKAEAKLGGRVKLSFCGKGGHLLNASCGSLPAVADDLSGCFTLGTLLCKQG
jgi:hypothetical protein